MEYNDTNAEDWKKHFKLEEDLAKRNPRQFETYKENIRKAYERAANGCENNNEGDGWLRIEWRK